MPLRSVSAAYLRQAEELRGNLGQLAAYESQGHCVVLAGPGSGKTKTLTVKLARLLAEDVRPPSGVACITYSQECARELSRRLEALGVRDAPNLFVGTIHSFCLRHLIVPFARLAGLPLPEPFTVATPRQAEGAYVAAGTRTLGTGQLPYKLADVGRHRRVHLDRGDEGWQSDPDLVRLTLAYEEELQRQGLVDFDGLVVMGHTVVAQHDWVLRAVRAKFPILAVDEYQDLGVPLHRIVLRLAFDGGIRLFAVGDPDQSVYGFTGADGELLQELARRPDVMPVRLHLNYRSAGDIVRASELALGETRGYHPHDGTRSAMIRMRRFPGGLADQARHIVEAIIPAALAAKPGRQLGDIAVLYRAASVGNVVAEALQEGGYEFIRVDSAAPYRKCELTSWIEDCAAWCAGGWQTGRPALRGLLDRWSSLLRVRVGESLARREPARLTAFLWAQRGEPTRPARVFVAEIRRLLEDLPRDEPSLADQLDQVKLMAAALSETGQLADLDIAALGTRDGSPTKANLLTLHSAKGCEYDVVVMVGLDLGIFPWRDERPAMLRESKRLFYVGLTRARDEVHMLCSGWVQTPYGRRNDGVSPFLVELKRRLDAAATASAAGTEHP
jgi:DNA helicase-2/ATP-dependent DNA helicase PcrA